MEQLSCDHLPGKFWPLQHSSIDKLFPDDPSHLIFNSSPIPQTPPLWSAEMSTATGIRLNRTEKTSHNAYERDRRQKLNTLYSSLRSLLPDTNETVGITSNYVLSQTQRPLSIPSTIARVVKYIPELQGQVERLQDMKKNMLKQKLSKVDCGKGRASPMISAICLNKEEVLIHICVRNSSAGTSRVSFPTVVKFLEGWGLRLLNSSSFTAHDGRTFHTMLLKAKEAIPVESRMFCEQLVNFLTN